MKMKNYILAFIVALVGLVAAYKITSVVKSSSVKSSSEIGSYWTCTMHPQIHQDHPGNCPICGMPLIKVDAKGKPFGQTLAPTSVDLTEVQKSRLGMQKYEVQKKSLAFKIPVSGRVSGSGSIVFYIYESDLNYVHPGLAFEGRNKVSSEYNLKGFIVSVDSIVDPTSRTVRVVGNVQDRNQKLFAETTVTANIIVSKNNVITIPEEVVLHTGKKDLVYVLDSENVLTPREVSLGLKSDGVYEVLSGLQVGEVVNAGSNFLIDSESKLRGVQE